MTDLLFDIEFHGPFRVGTGRAGNGMDQTIDPRDPLPASHLKGLMRSSAREVLGRDGFEPFIQAVYGRPVDGGASPWCWDSARPLSGEWHDTFGRSIARTSRVRIAVDDDTGTAAADQLVIGEELWPAEEFRARFVVSLTGRLGDDMVQLHAAMLRVSARAVTSVGSQRNRGLGWVTVRPADPSPDQLAADLDLLFAAAK